MKIFHKGTILVLVVIVCSTVGSSWLKTNRESSQDEQFGVTDEAITDDQNHTVESSNAKQSKMNVVVEKLSDIKSQQDSLKPVSEWDLNDWKTNFPFEKKYALETAEFSETGRISYTDSVVMHKQASCFWSSEKVIYSEAFFRFYQIMHEYGRVDSGYDLTDAFKKLKDYREYSKMDPEKVLWEAPVQQVGLDDNGEPIYKKISTDKDAKYYKQRAFDGMLFSIGIGEYYGSLIHKDVAIEIRERLISEIDPELFTEIEDVRFYRSNTVVRKLKPGDPLLTF